MSESINEASEEYLHQLAIIDRCYHPTGTFVKIEMNDLEQSIPRRFEKQVALYPDNLAIKTDDEEITYEELNRAANQVARAVLEQVGNGNQPVVLLFEQGTQAITETLGVLKAGKILVSLDPSVPRKRISYMVVEV